MTPKISVIMPAYNAEKYIQQAIGSILAQTYRDFELIIIEDGSADDTAARIGKYDDPRIIYIGFPDNQGIVEALNHGLKLSKGEYIARHDADDWSHPERFKRQMDNAGDVKADIVGCSMLLVDEDGFPQSTINYPYHVFHEQLMDKCCIAHPTVMFRREVYEKIGGYDEDFNMGCCEDYDYWLRAVEHFRICNMSTVLYTKRVHDDSNIGRAKKETIECFDELARLKARIRRLS